MCWFMASVGPSFCACGSRVKASPTLAQRKVLADSGEVSDSATAVAMNRREIRMVGHPLWFLTGAD
jgi:hypothetical protein